MAAPALATLLLPGKGMASGLFVMAGSLGWFFGGILGGVFYHKMGMRWVLTLAFFLCMFAAVVIIFSEDPKEFTKNLEKNNETISWSDVLRTPQIAIVVVTILLLYTGNTIFFGLSTNYFINIVGLSTFQVGLGISIASLIGAISSKVLGSYMDRHGRRIVFLFGILIYPMACFAYFLIRNPWIVTALWCFPYYVWAWTSGLAIMADHSHPSERAKTGGLFFASSSLTQASGTIIGGIVADHLGLRILALFPVPIGIGTFLFAYFLLKESLQKRNNNQLVPTGL